MPGFVVSLGRNFAFSEISDSARLLNNMGNTMIILRHNAARRSTSRTKDGLSDRNLRSLRFKTKSSLCEETRSRSLPNRSAKTTLGTTLRTTNIT